MASNMTTNNAEALRAETLEVLRNVAEELNATGRSSNRIERLIDALAWQPQAAGAGGDAVRWAEKYLSNLQAGDHAPGDEVMAVLWAGIEALAATPAPAVAQEAVDYREAFIAACASLARISVALGITDDHDNGVEPILERIAALTTPPAEAREPVGDAYRPGDRVRWTAGTRECQGKVVTAYPRRYKVLPDGSESHWSFDINHDALQLVEAQPQATPREPVDDARAVEASKLWRDVHRLTGLRRVAYADGHGGDGDALDAGIAALMSHTSRPPLKSVMAWAEHHAVSAVALNELMRLWRDATRPSAAPEPSAGEEDTARLDWLADAENAIEVGICGIGVGRSPAELRRRIDAARTAAPSDTTGGA